MIDYCGGMGALSRLAVFVRGAAAPLVKLTEKGYGRGGERKGTVKSKMVALLG